MKGYSGWVRVDMLDQQVRQRIDGLEESQFFWVGQNKFFVDGWTCYKGQRHFSCDVMLAWSRPYEYAFVAENLADMDKAARILDIGCGYTFFPFYIQSLGFQLDVMDIFNFSAYYVGTGVTFRKKDICLADDEENISPCYDVIYSISVIEHLQDWEAALRNAYAMLKPGGKLLLTFDVELYQNARKNSPTYHTASRLIHTLVKGYRMTHTGINFSRENLLVSSTFFPDQYYKLPWAFENISPPLPAMGIFLACLTKT